MFIWTFFLGKSVFLLLLNTFKGTWCPNKCYMRILSRIFWSKITHSFSILMFLILCKSTYLSRRYYQNLNSVIEFILNYKNHCKFKQIFTVQRHFVTWTHVSTKVSSEKESKLTDFYYFISRILAPWKSVLYIY